MPPTLFVCTHRRLGAASCGSNGGEELCDSLAAEIAARDLDWRVQTVACLGRCSEGPNMRAAPAGPFMKGCRPETAHAVVERLLAEWPVKS